MKKAIVIGATSGIGKSLALALANDNYTVGITARRLGLLEELKAQYPDKFITSEFDLTDIESAIIFLDKLVLKIGTIDLLILSSGNGQLNDKLDFAIEKQTIDLNVAAFTAVADWAFKLFQNQGSGHLVAITSIAGLRGSRQSPAYGASKAYQISYLQSLKQKATNLKLPIHITDIRPGFVDTAMAKGEGMFWVAPVDKAAKQMIKAIYHKRQIVYITKRWRLIAVMLKVLPDFIYNKL